mmetsp:Transcript_4145/g.10758  ORF Transcript_4145/g.10758 Transcript_4145/m.10758 type:complete len:294 (+) Transcript_4145:410-1291(+)
MPTKSASLTPAARREGPHRGPVGPVRRPIRTPPRGVVRRRGRKLAGRHDGGRQDQGAPRELRRRRSFPEEENRQDRREDRLGAQQDVRLGRSHVRLTLLLQDVRDRSRPDGRKEQGRPNDPPRCHPRRYRRRPGEEERRLRGGRSHPPDRIEDRHQARFDALQNEVRMLRTQRREPKEVYGPREGAAQHEEIPPREGDRERRRCAPTAAAQRQNREADQGHAAGQPHGSSDALLSEGGRDQRGEQDAGLRQKGGPGGSRRDQPDVQQPLRQESPRGQLQPRPEEGRRRRRRTG